jgi:hypothetical protein
MFGLCLAKHKRPYIFYTAFCVQVGMAGFEPTTSSTPCWRDTGLRYIPKGAP